MLASIYADMGDCVGAWKKVIWSLRFTSQVVMPVLVYNTQRATTATLPLTTHPQQWVEPHTFTFK